MPNGSPLTGTLGPAALPFGLPQNLGGTWPYVTATADQATASVELVVDNITAYDSITVYRVVGSTRTPIREANALITGGVAGILIHDYEAPLGASLTYVLNANNQDVATSNAVSLTYGPATFWIKDLSNPANSAIVEIQSIGKITRPARILTESNVLGRQNPHTVNDVRGGRQGSMVLTTASPDDQAAMIARFASGNVLFFQCPPEYGFPDMYFIAKDLDEEWLSKAGVLVHGWSFSFTEQDPPSTAANVTPVNTYLRATSFGTYQNALNKRATYLDALQRPWTETDGTG